MLFECRDFCGLTTVGRQADRRTRRPLRRRPREKSGLNCSLSRLPQVEALGSAGNSHLRHTIYCESPQRSVAPQQSGHGGARADERAAVATGPGHPDARA